MDLDCVGRRFRGRLNARAAAMRSQLDERLSWILFGWFFFASLACSARITVSGLQRSPSIDMLAPYVLLVCAPVASLTLALRWFSDGDEHSQPQYRIARGGRWLNIPRSTARNHALYGSGGMMVSLLIGILLNVPFRALEYLGAMPAISGPVPPWLSVLHTMMTLDVILMTSLYSIAFVAALRHVPLFPRMLVAIWAIDLAMQLATAEFVARTENVPAPVASALHSLLDGNVKKVLISVALWLPYLLLSKRVNVTFRCRVAS